MGFVRILQQIFFIYLFDLSTLFYFIINIKQIYIFFFYEASLNLLGHKTFKIIDEIFHNNSCEF